MLESELETKTQETRESSVIPMRVGTQSVRRLVYTDAFGMPLEVNRIYRCESKIYG